MKHLPHIITALWGLDFDGIAGKLEALGRLCGDIIAGASAVLAMLPNAHTLENHPRLAKIYVWLRHFVATLALDTTAPIRRLLHSRGAPAKTTLPRLDASASDTALPVWVLLLLAYIAALAGHSACRDAFLLLAH